MPLDGRHSPNSYRIAMPAIQEIQPDCSFLNICILILSYQLRNLRCINMTTTDTATFASTPPYWHSSQTYTPPSNPSLLSHADVMSSRPLLGSAVTYWLAKAGIEVLLIERDKPGRGASRRGLGLLSVGFNHSQLEFGLLAGKTAAEIVATGKPSIPIKHFAPWRFES